IDGQPWTQQTFPYQAKCLAWLREEHAALDTAGRRRFEAAIAGSGCEALFT
ncbi:MAG: glutathione S-transferase, partial [Caulobacteraceae bacterium]|nr:glutathione S-transferase [Caulobacteraceae bacterium]